MLKLIISILVCQCAGIIGSIFTRQAIPGWYAFIIKPSFNPPNWVFAPVWVTLYAMMGISAFLIWRNGLHVVRIRGALAVFLFQLFLNSLWSIIFFGFKSIIGGLAVIVLLWAAILWTIVEFYRISKLAAFLLVPYIVWVSFAFVLNIALHMLN